MRKTGRNNSARSLSRMIDIVLSSIFARFNHARISKHYRMAGNITIYKTIGSNQYIITDCYIPDNCGVDTDPNTVSNVGRSLALSTVFHADGNSLMNVAIIANNDRRIQGNIIRMTNIQTPSDFILSRDLNAIFFSNLTESIAIIKAQEFIFTALGFSQIAVEFLHIRRCFIAISSHIRSK